MENNQEEGKFRQTGAYGNVGAHEAQGDPIRSYVIVGWSVLWRLSDIARGVVFENMGAEDFGAKRHVSSMTRGHGHFQALETRILDRQLKYISSLPHGDFECYGYFLVHHIISAVFADRMIDTSRRKGSRRGQWSQGHGFCCFGGVKETRKLLSEGLTGERYGMRDSWLNWLVLREGPGFFARVWRSEEGNTECSRLITAEWRQRSKQQISIEQSAAKKIEKSLLDSSGTNYLRYAVLMDGARTGRAIERVFPHVKFYLGRRLPEGIIRDMDEDH